MFIPLVLSIIGFVYKNKYSKIAILSNVIIFIYKLIITILIFNLLHSNILKRGLISNPFQNRIFKDKIMLTLKNSE